MPESEPLGIPSVAEWTRLLDRAAIEDLVFEYSRTLDLNRPREVAALFSEDCVVDYGAGLGGRIEGREALARFLAEGLRNVAATSHHVSNVQIRFEAGGDATGTSYVYAWHRFPDGKPDATLWGQYHDRFRRTPEGWRIAERRLRVAGEQGMGFGDWHPIGRRPSGRVAETDA